MKISLIWVQSIDGYIAVDQNDQLNWRSRDDRVFFYRKSKEIQNIVLGGKSYLAMPEKVFETRKWFVFTRDASKYKQRDNVSFHSEDIESFIRNLEDQDIKEILVIGGAEIFSMFLNSGKFNDLYITIAPVVLGKGLKINIDLDNLNVKLIETIALNEKEVVLHYTSNTRVN
jgi:dihydrofolate reductase